MPSTTENASCTLDSDNARVSLDLLPPHQDKLVEMAEVEVVFRS
jgi:hypothetical protein